MDEKRFMEYAGDLNYELEMANSLLEHVDFVEADTTHTFTCSALLTIYCC